MFSTVYCSAVQYCAICSECKVAIIQTQIFVMVSAMLDCRVLFSAVLRDGKKRTKNVCVKNPILGKIFAKFYAVFFVVEKVSNVAILRILVAFFITF